MAGAVPRDQVSGGKVLSAGTKRSANRVRQALKMAAMTLSHSNSALGAFYRRLCSRMDKPRRTPQRRIKAARMVYFMLARGEAFRVVTVQGQRDTKNCNASAASLRGKRRPPRSPGSRQPHQHHGLPAHFVS